jgi:hypothetical protein
LPPYDEQNLIVETNTVETTAISRSVARVNREISLLYEYRTRLIADVVTGKLDVREAAARLQHEAEEPEPIVEEEGVYGSDAETDDPDLEEAMAEAGA